MTLFVFSSGWAIHLINTHCQIQLTESAILWSEKRYMNYYVNSETSGISRALQTHLTHSRLHRFRVHQLWHRLTCWSNADEWWERESKRLSSLRENSQEIKSGYGWTFVFFLGANILFLSEKNKQLRKKMQYLYYLDLRLHSKHARLFQTNSGCNRK